MAAAPGARAQSSPPPPPNPTAYVANSLSFWQALLDEDVAELRLTRGIVLSAADLVSALEDGYDLLPGDAITIYLYRNVTITSNTSGVRPLLDFSNIPQALDVPFRVVLSFASLRLKGMYSLNLTERPVIFTDTSNGVVNFTNVVTQRAACTAPEVLVANMRNVSATGAVIAAQPPSGRALLSDRGPAETPAANNTASDTATLGDGTDYEPLPLETDPNFCPQPLDGEEALPCFDAIIIQDFSYKILPGNAGGPCYLLCNTPLTGTRA